MKSKIFIPFFQGKHRPPGSSGLGLTIVGELVSLFGGTINFTSEEGVGTEFNVKIPVTVYQGGEIENTGTVLLVEDDESICETFSKLIQSSGYRVITVNSECEALLVIAEVEFSVIILDLQLSDGHGYNVASKIKQSLNKITPIIAMTAYSVEFQDSRADLVYEKLEKPVDFAILMRLLEQYAPIRRIQPGYLASGENASLC